MNKIKKIILSTLFVLVITIGTIAFAKDADIYLEDEVSTIEEIEQVKLNHQKVIEQEYSPNLEKCTFIDYKTNVKEIVNNLDEVTKETSKEKDAYKNAKEEEGYTVTVETKEHSGKTNVYKFTALNGVITKATINGKDYKDLVGKNLKESLNKAQNYENDEIRVVYTKEASSSAVTNNQTVTTEEEAKELVKKLQNEGYEASYKQNNNDKVTITLTSKTSLTEEDIKNKLQEENKNEEVKDVEITKTTTPSTYTSKKYTNKSDATKEYNELLDKNIYESVELKTLIDETNANKVLTKQPFTWTKDDTNPYTEDVYTENVKTGYKYYYAINEVIEEAQNKKETGLTEASCKKLLNSHTANDGWTSKCEKVTSIIKSEEESNVIEFNDTKQTKRTWRHLDISVNQNITVIDKDGNTVATGIQGKLSNPRVVLNEGTSNEKQIRYNNPTYDGNRLEVRQNTSNGYTQVTNEDKVKIYTTLSYTYNGKNISKDIVLEGYLNNQLNVCREKNQYGGGFDLEFDVLVDREGNVYIVIRTEETWTFTASKEAETKLQGYYDEYEYQKQYQVIAIDEDYTYDVEYVSTTYTVNSNGSSETATIEETIYDKYYVINGSKTTYKVTTVGNIEKDDNCGTGGDDFFGKLIVNYITTDGTKLQEPLSYTERENTPYETIKKSFSGYRFVKAEGQTKGEYIANDTIVVTYIYEKMPSVNTGIIENNNYTTILLVSSVALVALLVFKKKIFE